jgi:bifunctional non-homologous end joining protein LigD
LIYPFLVAAKSKADDAEILTIEGPDGPHVVRISNPAKLYFSRETQLTKLDLARYYLAIAPGALQGIQDRPIVLKRFVNGACLADGTQPEPFYQKRAPDPATLPPFLRTVTLSFPSGRTAEELVVDNAPGLAWIANLGCIELHPHPVRAADLDHPDELRIDLDPQPGIAFDDVRRVALEVDALLTELGLHAFAKTSGSRGMHLNVRIHPRWSFTEVRRAALALARAVERRAPSIATSKWWKEERHGVFLDYNQNAKDRTTCSAYSVRPLPDARVSAPLHWRELPACNPADFTVLTMPTRFASYATGLGDPFAAMDANPYSLEPLLDLAARDESEGQGDAPWPPHFAKQANEPKRVQPSKAKAFSDQLGEGFGAKRFRKRATATAFGSPSTDSGAPTTEPGAPTEPGSPTTEPGAPSFAASSQRVGSEPPTESAIQPTKPARKTPTKRTPKHPLLTIAQSPDKSAAEAGLTRWKQNQPEAATHLAEDDILIDRMRGASTIWYRIRVNLRHVPEDQRPTQLTPDPDDDPTRAWRQHP